jgi:hypothetical protein
MRSRKSAIRSIIIESRDIINQQATYVNTYMIRERIKRVTIDQKSY